MNLYLRVRRHASGAARSWNGRQLFCRLKRRRGSRARYKQFHLLLPAKLARRVGRALRRHRRVANTRCRARAVLPLQPTRRTEFQRQQVIHGHDCPASPEAAGASARQQGPPMPFARSKEPRPVSGRSLSVSLVTSSADNRSGFQAWNSAPPAYPTSRKTFRYRPHSR